MPAALDVNKEEVRMLVLAVGVREAARQMGLAEGTVLAWANRGGWLNDTRARPASLPRPASLVPRAIVAIKPADCLENTLKDRQKQTKLGLSSWLAETSGHLGSLKGEDAAASHPVAVSAASVMAKVWPEQQVVGQTVINVALLGMELPQDVPLVHDLPDAPTDEISLDDY